MLTMVHAQKFFFLWVKYALEEHHFTNSCVAFRTDPDAQKNADPSRILKLMAMHIYIQNIPEKAKCQDTIVRCVEVDKVGG